MRTMTGFMVGLGWALDVLSLKPWSDAIFAKYVRPGDHEYPVHRSLWTQLGAGNLEAALDLAQSSWQMTRSLRVGRGLIHILLKLGRYDEAFDVSLQMIDEDRENAWIRVLAADIRLFFLGDQDGALPMFLEAMPYCEAAMPDIYPLAVLYKRLTGIYKDKGDEEKLLSALDKFLSLAPTNFHDDEFILLAQMKLDRGDTDGAKEVLETGFKAMTRCKALRDAYEKMGFGSAPPIPPLRVPGFDPETARRRTIKTRLLTEVDDPIETVAGYVKGQVPAGGVVALSSCIAAIMEGRMLMEGTLHPCFLAKIIARLIEGAHPVGPFGASAPMANPLSAQAALEEVGTLRMLAATFAAGLAKVFRAKGWFYVIAGPQVAQIDDILGSIPPYDYYVMLGPKDSFALSEKIALTLGDGVEVALVDANDLGVAWAVGYSKGVKAKSLEQAMLDNPAGNQDQMTPLVIVELDSRAAMSPGQGWE